MFLSSILAQLQPSVCDLSLSPPLPNPYHPPHEWISGFAFCALTELKGNLSKPAALFGISVFLLSFFISPVVLYSG
jgi:hypothetical protein